LLASAIGRSHTIVATTLNRLEAAGLVIGQMEPLDQATNRAPRRYFTLTDKGVRFVMDLAERKQAEGRSLLRLAMGYQAPG
jgi:DNA-binding PadR family transcriptional regulator